MTRAAAAVVSAAIAIAGCHLSHERGDRPRDSGRTDAATRDAATGDSCRFTVRTPDRETTCTISLGSGEGCTEAALCLCRAREGASPTEIVRCTGGELTPRGAITLADFCTIEPPGRMTMTEALEGYLSFGGEPVSIGSECATMPALIGPRPYEQCAFLANIACDCSPSDCDLDAALGRECTSLSREEATCILAAVRPDGACSVDLRTAAAACAGP